jgi:adenine-specific DNA methylase
VSAVIEKARLIEKKFPLAEINTISEYEMSFLKLIPRDVKAQMVKLLGVEDAKGRNLPKINNLMYYPARRPSSAARAVTLAAVLDEDVPLEDFEKALGFERMKEAARKSGTILTLYMVDPDRELVTKLLGRDPKSVVVVDPMAGGGSIPLEALRLGFTAIAGDYNPVAYLLLRATIEFPAKYGKRLYQLVEEEARKMLEYARKELGRFYGENDKGYIFFRVAHHDCGGILPVVQTGALNSRKGVYVNFDFDKEAKVPVPRISNKQPPPLTTCPYCGKPVSERALQARWVEEHVKLLEALLSGDESAADRVTEVYLLAAIQQAGRGRRGRGYRTPTQEDLERLRDAARELARMAKSGEILSLIPLAEIPASNNVFEGVRETGLKYWYQLYNPRQLFALAKLISYVRREAEVLRKTCGELGIAVALYLAIALAKLLDYNSLPTQWNAKKQNIRSVAGSQYAGGKRVKLGYDFSEAIIPFVNLPWILEEAEESYEENYHEESEEEYEEIEATRGGMLPVLKLLCYSLEGLWAEGRDYVYLWDATKLDETLDAGSVDIVHVDPPYYDQHDYSGITEFFWVVAQQALLPVLDQLFPGERVKIDWSPYDPEIPRQLEVRGEPPKEVGYLSAFGEKMSRFLRAAARVLKPDGLLVMWYAYGKLQGWEELFYRFYESGYKVTKTWQVWSEFGQRRVALQAKAFLTSIVIAARPNAKRAPLASADDPAFKGEVERAVSQAPEFFLSTYGLGRMREALVTALADGFSVATRYELLTLSEDLVFSTHYRRLAEVALRASVEALLKQLAAFAGAKTLSLGSLDVTTRLYTFLLLAADDERHISYDFANRVAQALRSPALSSLIRDVKGGAALLAPPDAIPDVAARKAYALICDLSDIAFRYGLRAAEDRAREADRQIAALAYYYAFLCQRKLGLTLEQRDAVLSALGGALK